MNLENTDGVAMGPANVEADKKALFEAMAGIQQRLGMPVSNYGKETAPVLMLKNRPLREIARTCAENILRHGEPKLFLMGKTVVTIDERSGEVVPMDGDKFRSWVEHYMVITDKMKIDEAGRSVPVPTVIPVEIARGVLKSHDFIYALPRLRGVNLVKQPVWRKPQDGEPGRVELLRPGYDAASEIYTLAPSEKPLDYAEDWTLGRAHEFMDRNFRYFPWGGEDGVDKLATAGVSFAAVLSMWLTNYGLTLLPPETPTPAFLMAANNPGSGKTRMVEIITLALYGRTTQNPWPQEKKETDKLINKIDSMMLSGAGYLFFDNLPPGHFSSPLLEGLLTSGTHATRLFNTQIMSNVERRCVVMLTGNKITLSDDMGERTIICDFWAEDEAVDRQLPKEAIDLTTELLHTAEFRGEFLSCLWAMVKYAHGPEAMKEPGAKHNRFPVWARIIASIVPRCKLADPTKRRKLAGTGNTERDDLNLLRDSIVEEYCGRYDRPEMELPSLQTIVPMARKLNLFTAWLGTTRDTLQLMTQKRLFREIDGELTDSMKQAQAEEYIEGKSMSTMVGTRIVSKLIGQRAKDSKGRMYYFGKRGQANASTITIKIIR